MAGQKQGKKGAPKSVSCGSQTSHKARGRDIVQVLKRVIQSSGLGEAETVAARIDKAGLPGTSSLNLLKTKHQETRPGGKLAWVDGPAAWMRRAMEASQP